MTAASNLYPKARTSVSSTSVTVGEANPLARFAEPRSKSNLRPGFSLVSLPGNYGICFSDGATFVACSFQRFVSNFRPKLFQFRGSRLARVPFSVIRSPWHWTASLKGECQRRLGRGGKPRPYRGFCRHFFLLGSSISGLTAFHCSLDCLEPTWCFVCRT